MSQEEKKSTKVEELEKAKNKLSILIDALKENPSLSEEEISKIAGGVKDSLEEGGLSGDNSPCNTNGLC